MEGRNGYSIGIDVGGTFTDMVLAGNGIDLSTFKVFTVRGNEAQGVFDVLEKAAAASGVAREDILGETRRFVFGSTIAANALLEKRGARAGFISTKGFRDTLIMRRMFRENQYDLHAEIPVSIFRRKWMLEAPERVDRDGEIVEPLTDSAIDDLVEQVRELELEAVGISLLFSFRNPEHERRIKAALQIRLPHVYVVASSDVAPEIRDYERASTTALSAYLGPRVARHLLDLEDQLRNAGLACEMEVMTSNGGVCTVAAAAAQPVDMLLSGPAGGVSGALYLGSILGETEAIAFDMGGTSCDISVVSGGRTLGASYLAGHTRFEGWDVLRPFLNIHALGAGGGSVAWRDDAGGMHVGPHSAGADPGPVCYRRGGAQPTVTDADLYLGYLNADNFFGREISLDIDSATAALADLGEPLGFSAAETASGIFRIVNSAMADGIRVVLADRGADAREFTLICFGGAGGIHASALIRDLGISRLVIPREAAVFSALGLLLSDARYDYVRTVFRDLAETSADRIFQAFEDMLHEAEPQLGRARAASGWNMERVAEMRYAGQTHDLRVVIEEGVENTDAIRGAFESAYEEAYGFVNDTSPIQLVNLRLTATGHTLKPELPAESEPATALATETLTQRNAYFDEVDDWVLTPVLEGEQLRPGTTGAGPVILELPTTTIVVRPRQRLLVDGYRNVIIETGKGA